MPYAIRRPYEQYSPEHVAGMQQMLANNPGLGNLYARNRAQRTISPYAASPGENPSPAGIYATSGFAGRMSNYGAQQNYGATGYMPGRTVGGAYGLPQGPLPFEQTRPLNLGSALYGGAQPGLVAVKPAWVSGPERMASAGSLPDNRYIGGGLLGRAGQANLTPISEGSPQYAAMQKARAMFDARGGGLLARQEAYQARNAAPLDPREAVLARVGIRAQNAAEKQQQAMTLAQNQMMMGLAMRNPGLALGMAQLNQRGLLAQQQMGLQYAQMGQQGNIAAQNSSDRRYVADQGLLTAQNNAWAQRYSAAITAGNTPDDAARLAGPSPAAGGSGAPQSPVAAAPGGVSAPRAGYRPKKQLLDAQLSTIASLPKGKREAALRGMGVTEPRDLHHYQSQIDPQYNYPTGIAAIANSPLLNGSLADRIGRTEVDPYGPYAGLFGINPPPLVGLSPQAQAALARRQQQQ